MRMHYRIAAFAGAAIAWVAFLLGTHSPLALAYAIGSTLCTILAFASEKKETRLP